MQNRKPAQGVLNIIRFNWHFYVVAAILILILATSNTFLSKDFQLFGWVFLGLLISSIAISLLVSFYVYDVSKLYDLPWLNDFNKKSILNISAGFDETSSIIRAKFPEVKISICDFYNPKKHTEVSIKRARKAYPPDEDTIEVETTLLPFESNTFDFSLVILSAHEIRNQEERIEFFNELKRVTKPNGRIMVTEHLRDLPNFLAYNIGFLHFHSKVSWYKTFRNSGLLIEQELKTTPFISTFILSKNGNAA